MATPIGKSRLVAAGAALAALVFALYARTAGYAFAKVDVAEYLTENPHLQHGFTLEGLRWAWGANYASNWHPLTWMSHMLDVELFGFSEAGHNLENVAWHAANSVLVLLVFASWTQRFGASVFIAACFALHPQHVESVAWIAERKDVLAAFFGLATLLFWTRYAREGARGSYALALVAFALGLCAKPSLVTWPAVLLLLDAWPFARGNLGWRRLVLEKLPFVALAALSSALTWWAQSTGRAMEPLAHMPFGLRALNALFSYGRYALRTLWPSDLAPFYPHRGSDLPLTWIAASALCVALALGLAFAWRRKRPWFGVGVCFYLGTLVPMIGFVQVGAQALADRYTYLPLLGLFLVAAYGASELARSHPRTLAPVVATACALVAAQFAVSWRQVAFWKDSETLGRREIAAVGRNGWAYNLIGGFLLEKQRFPEAAEALRQATELAPNNEQGWIMLGKALSLTGDPAGAELAFRKALALFPDNTGTLNHLATLLIDGGDSARLAEAQGLIDRALVLDPLYAGAHNTNGRLWIARGDLDAAEREFALAVTLFPQFLPARMNLARQLMRRGDFAGALAHIDVVLARLPDDVEALRGRGRALTALGREREALAVLERLLAARPGWPPVLGDLCWLLASARDPALRDLPRAVELGEQGFASSQGGAPAVTDALALAYALSGRFDDAVSAARNAVERALAIGDTGLAQRIQRRVEAYRERRVDESIPR